MVVSSSLMRSLVVFLAAVLIMAPVGRSLPGQTEEAVDEWFNKVPNSKPKITKLHFFIHDIAAGPDPSYVPVAQANCTASSPTQFGIVHVVDDQLTLGPEEDSATIGRVQGVYVSAAKETVGLLAAINFVITSGEHEGSTLSVLGRIAEFSDNREFPVLGGSGNFRLAQGIAIAKVHSADPATGNRIVECRFTILHYDERSLKSVGDSVDHKTEL